jgi:ADP-ribosylglycohydrolase.
MKLLRLGYLALLSATCSAFAQTPRLLPENRLREAIEGYWIGQLAGNYLGLPFENLYKDEPMPLLVDRYYTFKDAGPLGLMMNLDDRRAYLPILADALGGAWSDDDSDIEFVYLQLVEQHGLDPTYEQVTEAWRMHINRFIWGANRRARDLMDEGFIAPATGAKENNREWYRISSQLTTEIWGVFHPGATERGGHWAQWAGRVSTDDWATHPDRFFGTLFSAAFFETDPAKLVELGRRALPDDSPFREGIDDLVRWRAELPDWRDARARLHEKYYHEIRGFVVPDPVAGSIINGLAGVLALLYGDGDWMKTVSISISAGYDCDNQAATCAALLAMIHGAKAIPAHITHELPSRGRWQEPFNNTYINYSRDGLPAFNRNSDIIARIQAVAEKSILQHGGERIDTPTGPAYRVLTDF